MRHLQRENYQLTMMRKELKKVDEYKENMYFEAVQDILSKINDPKTKGSAKVFLRPISQKSIFAMYTYCRNSPVTIHDICQRVLLCLSLF